jgi:spore maturation protein CgeB
MVLSVTESGGTRVYDWTKKEESQPDTAAPAPPAQQALPAPFSSETLKKNLDALASLDRRLVDRLCLPVDGSHIRFLTDGQVRYERHRNLLPFAIPQERVAATVGSGLPEEVLLFGAGLGEQLDFLLSSNGRRKITVWERDPWLLRLVLMKRDYSSFIRSGRLCFALCSDLLDLIRKGTAQIISHPFLQTVYENEYLLLRQGIGNQRAMVCSGGIFVDDISQTLRTQGFSLYTLDIKRLSIQEIERTVRSFDPRFLFAVNYTHGLVELSHKLGVPLLCWEVDPAADRLRPPRTPSESAYIFTYRRLHVDDFKGVGFKNVEYLPLASDPGRRSPPDLSAEDRERYGAPLSFVGSSMVGQAASFRQIFLQQYKAYRDEAPEAIQEGNVLLEQILSTQRRDFSTCRIRELLEQHFSEFIRSLSRSGFSHDPYMLVAEIAAAEKRINYISNLARLGVKVWGDEGWKVTERFGVKLMGRAGHFQEINKIYGASLVNVDINRLYQPDIVTMRIFDIMACGGFVLAEQSDALKELFAIGKEVEVYSTLAELISKATYYLQHSDEAAKIASAGREAVLRDHTIRERVAHMLRCGGFAESEAGPR